MIKVGTWQRVHLVCPRDSPAAKIPLGPQRGLTRLNSPNDPIIEQALLSNGLPVRAFSCALGDSSCMAIPLPNADVAYFGGHPVDQPRGRDGEGARGGAAGRRRGVSVVNTREEDSDAVGILRDREGKRKEREGTLVRQKEGGMGRGKGVRGRWRDGDGERVGPCDR